MTLTLATPDEHIKIVATYMRPSPQSNPTARAEWRELTDYAVSLGIHRHTALLIGDFNASMNTHEVRHVQNGSGVHIDMNPLNKKIKRWRPGVHIDMNPGLEPTIHGK